MKGNCDDTDGGRGAPGEWTLSLEGLRALKGGCAPCAAHRPGPQPDGTLVVDSEIHLPSPGMDLDIAYYYSSSTQYNGPFGFGRSLSHNLTAQASGSPAVVTLTRGDGAIVSYQDDGMGHFVPKTVGLLNSLVKDTPDSLWQESTPDGILTAYRLDTTGMVTSATYAQDAVGNRHTFGYSSGLLTSLKDSVGRLVTLSYSATTFLQSIQDWAGRLTTFLYDAVSIPGVSLLATVTGPSGCQTGYQYDGNGLLTGIIDPNGYGTSYLYSSGQVTSRTVTGVGSTAYTFSSSQAVVTNPLGYLFTHSLDANGMIVGWVNEVGAVMTFTRNSQGQETSRKDPLGHVTTTAYDLRREVARMIVTRDCPDVTCSPTSTTLRGSAARQLTV